MRKMIVFIALFLGISTNLYAQEKTHEHIMEATKGVTYGAGVPDDITYNVYDTDQLIKEINKTQELKNIIIEAVVTAVCEKKGCWITLQNSSSEKIFVKMQDYAFFLPQNIVGKKVLLHADVSKKVTSIEELRHYAKDAKKSTEEINAIKSPKGEIRVLAKGIKVL